VIENVAKENSVDKEKVKRDMEKNKARSEVLKAFEVNIEEIPSKDYENFYQQFISRHL
jgi:hypothetical protein